MKSTMTAMNELGVVNMALGGDPTGNGSGSGGGTPPVTGTSPTDTLGNTTDSTKKSGK